MAETVGHELKTPLEYALLYHTIRCSVIPLRNPEHRDDGMLELEKTDGVPERKTPDIYSLDDAKKIPATEEQIIKWFKEEDPNRNVGVFCGKVSGNLIVIDVDGEDSKTRVDSLVLQNNESEVRTAFLNTMVVTTGSGGKHYYLILNDPIMETMPSVKIWDSDKPHTEISIFANNHYVVGAGSRHPNNNSYVWNGKKPIPISKRELIEFVRLVPKNPDEVLSDLERGGRGVGYYWSNNKITPTMTTTTTSTAVGNNLTLDDIGWVEGVAGGGTNNLTIAEAKVSRILGRLYKQGSREEWWLVVSGLLRRHPNITLHDAMSVCRNICENTDDEEIGKRLKTVETTFTSKQPVEVASRSYFEKFVKLQTNGLDKEQIDKYVKNLEHQVLSALFELELEVIQRDNPCWLWDNKDGEKYIVVRKSDSIMM